MEPLIGIDLGTTNSLCAIFDGEPRLIPNALGEYLTPSAVGMVDEDQLVIGAPAKELQITQPNKAAVCFKRLMGTNEKIRVNDREFTATELSSLVLKSLKEDAEKFLKVDIQNAVITVPAYFNDNQRKATKLAGEMAGLRVRRVVNEPTAAALTYGFHDQNADKKILVMDLGGGTFDVTIMEIFEGSLEIMATAGESFLGGEDFTNRLVHTCLEQKGYNFEIAELKFPQMLARLTKECERAKRLFLTEESTTISFPDESGKSTDKIVQLSRKQFSDVNRHLMKRLERPVTKVLRDTDILPDEIDDVILVGGATRMTIIREFVCQLFKKEPNCKFDPDQVVALGAAIQAALIDDDAAVDDMVMTDVCPFTLGIEVVKTFGSREIGGYYMPIIHRNTTIPVSKEDVISTIHANQTQIQIRVFQGESRKVADNIKLGELAVSGIPRGPAKQEVFVRFCYDANGILDVEAYIPETGKKFGTVLTNHVKGLSNKEISKAIERLQQLKFYPREDIKNRHLLLFCERVSGDISLFERKNFEDVVDLFEESLSSNDRDFFARVRQDLLICLSSLGHPYSEPKADSE